ncbi:hypothetical protein D3C81_806240 [compost metagenome]
MPLAVCAALPALMVKSVGSINHVPVLPFWAAVVTLAVSATCTWAPLVSMKPPSPPWGALASRVPSTCTVPPSKLPNRTILPSFSPSVRAWITPVLLITVLSRASPAWAVSSTWPPSALISWWFSTKASTMASSTCTLSRPLPAKSRVMALPAASATLPWLATITPWLLTVPPSRAMAPPALVLSEPWLITAALWPSPLKR